MSFIEGQIKQGGLDFGYWDFGFKYNVKYLMGVFWLVELWTENFIT